MAKKIKRVKYPTWLETVDCTIIIDNSGLSEDGEPIPGKVINTKCIYSEQSRRVIDKEGKTVKLVGKIIKNGDIMPDLSVIGSGRVIIFNTSHEIYAASRPRNPDGTVHHTELEIQ